MVFEYDPAKNLSNKRKHGIDFITAQKLWEDDYRLHITIPLLGEPRYLVIGRIDLVYWSAIITYRDETVRLISVRRARKKEIKLYENI